MKKTPLVSVLVHTKNSERTIYKHLKSIKEQSYQDIEIIVVDNNSGDKTLGIAKKFTEKIYDFGPERSAQRNFAARKASGDYYLVPDSDMILGKNVILECVDLVLNNPQIKAVIIPEKSIGEGFWAKCKALERQCYLKDETIEAARFFDRGVFWEFGGYDESFTGPEDWDLSQRIREKYQIGRIKSFILHDEGRVSLFNLARKKFYYGKSLSQYLKKHSPRTTLPQVFYFARPAFYKNWRLLLRNPLVSAGMFLMLFVEQLAGFLGYLAGRLKYEET